jgi:hypothetical protein
VATGDGTANLTPLGVAGQALHIEMLPPAGSGSNGRATVAVNSLGALDLTLSPDQIARLDAASAIPLGTPHEQISDFAATIAGGKRELLYLPAIPVA